MEGVEILRGKVLWYELKTIAVVAQVPVYLCLSDSCHLKHTKHYYCDECENEVDILYQFESEELCINCIEKRLERIE